MSGWLEGRGLVRSVRASWIEGMSEGQPTIKHRNFRRPKNVLLEVKDSVRSGGSTSTLDKKAQGSREIGVENFGTQHEQPASAKLCPPCESQLSKSVPAREARNAAQRSCSVNGVQNGSEKGQKSD